MRPLRLLSFMVLTSIVISTSAQFGERARLGCPNGTQSIVRTGSGIYYYVYMQNNTTQGYFYQVERSSNLTLKTVNLSAGYVVTDFVLYNGKIYFTGDYNGATGYVGWFNVDSVFNGNGTIHYYQFKYTPPFPIFTTLYYKDFRKIKVFNVGANIHALVLGSRYSLLSTGSNCCLMDYQIGSTSFTYAYNTSFSEYFDDIAITNSAAVVASRKGANITGTIYMRKFPLASFSLGNSAGQKLYYPDNETLSETHLQSTSSSSDTFFVIYYSEKYTTGGLLCQGLRINCCKVTNSGITSGGNSTIVSNQGTTLSSACRIRETAYNTRWRRLLVLQDMDAPISPATPVSAVCGFLFTSAVVSFDRATYRNGNMYTSLSMYNAHSWIACVMQNQMANILIEHCTNTSSFSCATLNMSLTTINENPLFSNSSYNLTISTEAVTHYTSSPTITPSIYIEDCIHTL